MYAQDIGDKDVDNELFLIARVYKIGIIFTLFGFKFFSRQLLPACCMFSSYCVRKSNFFRFLKRFFQFDFFPRKLTELYL